VGRVERHLFIASALAAASGCVLFGSLDDLTGGGTADAGGADAPIRADAAIDSAPIDATPFDAGEVDGAAITFETCNATHIVFPNAPDGFYLLSGVDGGPPFEVYCDMTNDGGGWMLVTPAMVASESLTGVTSVHQSDDNGGLVVLNYANSDACAGNGAPSATNLIMFSINVPWSQIRAKYAFDGLVGCWHLFGSNQLSHEQNLFPFDPGADTIYDEVKMGGVLADGGPVDAFDGTVDRCDGTGQNFWDQNTLAERSGVVILRRSILTAPAGLSTNAYCLNNAQPGTASTTFWSYRDIYVR
jgi:hypothetical protein